MHTLVITMHGPGETIMTDNLFYHELFPQANKDQIIKKLLEAYADEWVAGYYYQLTAHTIQGPYSEEIAEHFFKEAEEEINKHARIIAERLQQLGVDLPRDFSKIMEISGCKYPPLPQDPHDVDGWLIAAIKAEICAINAYKQLFELTHGVDPVTEELAEDLLADETRHRTELTALLTREGLERLKKELGSK